MKKINRRQMGLDRAMELLKHVGGCISGARMYINFLEIYSQATSVLDPFFI
jgi:hypothetical protein